MVKKIDTTPVALESGDGLPFHIKGAGWIPDFTTNEGYALPLPTREDGVDPKERLLGTLKRSLPAPLLHSFLTEALTSMAEPESQTDIPSDGQNHLFAVIGGYGIGKTVLAKLMNNALSLESDQVTYIPGSVNGGDFKQVFIETTYGDTPISDIFTKVEDYVNGKGARPEVVEALTNGGMIESIETESGTRYAVNSTATNDVAAFASAAEQFNIIAAPQSRTLGKRNGPLNERLLQLQDYYEEHGEAMPSSVWIDEATRIKEWGADAAAVFQLFKGAGEKSQSEAKAQIDFIDSNGNPAKRTINGEALSRTLVMVLGNPPSKSDLEARELPEFIQSRARIHDLREEGLGAEGYAQLTSNLLTGGTINLYGQVAANIDRYSANPGAAAKEITEVLSQGLSEAEQKTLPNGVRQQLAKAGDLYEASQLLGNVFSGVEDIARGKVPHLKGEAKHLHQPFDFRSVKDAFSRSGNLPPAARPNPREPMPRKDSMNVGTHFVHAILHEMDELFPAGKFDETRKEIGKLLSENRVITPEIAQSRFGMEGSELLTNTSEGRLVEDLINVGPEAGRAEEIAATRELLFNIAQQRFPDLGLNDPETAFPAHEVSQLIDGYREQLEKGDASAAANLVIPNLELSLERGEGGKPKFNAQLAPQTVETQDAASDVISLKGNSNSLVEEILLKKLLEQKQADFGSVFTAPSFSFGGMEEDNPYSICDGTHPAGIHITTLNLGSRDNPELVALVRNQPKETENNQQATYLLVGDKALSEETVTHLKGQNITYLDRSGDTDEATLTVSNYILHGMKRIENEVASSFDDSQADRIDPAVQSAHNDFLMDMANNLNLRLGAAPRYEGNPLISLEGEDHARIPRSTADRVEALARQVVEGTRMPDASVHVASARSQSQGRGA